MPQLLSPRALGPVHCDKEATAMGSPGTPAVEQALLTATRESPWGQRRPLAAENKNAQKSVALGSGLDFIVELRRRLVVIQTHFCFNG